MQEHGKKLPEHLLIQASLSVLCCIILAIGWHSERYLAAQLYPLCVFQGLHFIWVIWSWSQASGYYFSPYTLFFIAVQFFNGGVCLLEIFKLNKHGVLGEYTTYVSVALINKSVALATAGMVCIHLGALLGAYWRRVKNQNKKSARKITIQQENSFVKAFGWLFFAIGAVPAIYNAITSLQTSLSDGYVALYYGEPSYGLDNWITVASLFCIPGLLMLLTAYSDGKIMAAFFLCFSALLCFLSLLAGGRGTMVMLFLATLWLFHFRIKKIPPKLFVIGAVTAFIVCPVIAHMRKETGLDRFSPSKLFNRISADRNPFVASLKTMGGSLRTVPYTMMVVPEKRKHMWGMGYVWAATTVYPNTFWPEHPALKHTNYGKWLTKIVQPNLDVSAHAVGFSLFAEMYLNFSWYGTPFVCIIFGFAVGNFSAIASHRAGPLFYGTAAILISVLPYFARGSSEHIMRPIFWFCVFPCLVFCLWRLCKRVAVVPPPAKLEISCLHNSTLRTKRNESVSSS